tara:strand:+ start:138 stop:398 length:261 start_codon:yes stop_codon:yes gene_type:complete
MIRTKYTSLFLRLFWAAQPKQRKEKEKSLWIAVAIMHWMMDMIVSKKLLYVKSNASNANYNVNQHIQDKQQTTKRQSKRKESQMLV